MKYLILITLFIITSCSSTPLTRFGKKPHKEMQKEINEFVDIYKNDKNYHPDLKKNVDSVLISTESRYDSRGYCVVREGQRELVINYSLWKKGNALYKYKLVSHGLTQCLYRHISNQKVIWKF